MNSVSLRLVKIEDSLFLTVLRNKENLNKYINNNVPTVEIQQKWIQSYKQREQEKREYYFIVVNNTTNDPCGTVRIYDINYEKSSATWGSFILDPERRPEKSAYEVIEKSLSFCFEKLGLKTIHLDVKVENKKAIHIYEKVGFQYSHQVDDTLYYSIQK